jgi:DNA modification methylase
MIKNIGLPKEKIESTGKEISEWGTFKESLKAPIHGWFTYPAGFSYKAVEHTIDLEKLIPGVDTIYDPFMGSGTTNIVAKTKGINSVGVEAHPFVHFITTTKINWDIKHEDVLSSIEAIKTNLFKAKYPQNPAAFFKKEFPELIMKCFLPETLFELLIIRNSIKQLPVSNDTKDFLKVALICVLRDVSIAATGWPYIAPNKIKITSMSKKGADTYFKKTLKMFGDFQEIKAKSTNIKSEHSIILGDSRKTEKEIESNSISHIFTSPPYLNNFDYADRTRLEMYFMGDANNWADISEKIRTKLVTSATTQISRTDVKYKFKEDFIKDCPKVHEVLSKAVLELAAMRLIKGGKKSYDLLVTGYFNDLYDILKENYRVLKPNSKAIYILGDSAPYGVHIATDELIGKIGKCVGFKNYKIEVLRLRGGKWASNPQRHSVPLKESVVTLFK